MRFHPCLTFKSQKGTAYTFQLLPPYILLVRYRVPKLEGLAVGRHPVYGTSLKRLNVKTESDEFLESAKKKKKKRKSGNNDKLEEPLVVKEEPESVEEPKKMKKKKKDKRD